MNNFNNNKTNLKFTYEYSKNEINFLDLKVKFEKGSLVRSVYIKPTDRHQYLHYRSSHPDHIKRSKIYSQVLRINRLCSREIDFLDHIHKVKSWFEKQGYPQNMINREIGRVKFGENKQNWNKSAKSVPFVATYHPMLIYTNH